MQYPPPPTRPLQPFYFIVDMFLIGNQILGSSVFLPMRFQFQFGTQRVPHLVLDGIFGPLTLLSWPCMRTYRGELVTLWAPCTLTEGHRTLSHQERRPARKVDCRGGTYVKYSILDERWMILSTRHCKMM